MKIFTSSLSTKLLLLTILFVMLSEILIFVPSVARFRLSWLEERLSAGHLAVITEPQGQTHTHEVLAHINAQFVQLTLPSGTVRTIERIGPYHDQIQMPDPIVYDLRSQTTVSLIRGGFDALFHQQGQFTEVVGYSPRNENVLVRTRFLDADLRKQTRLFAWRIFLLSLVISFFTAGLVFVSLHRLMVRPMRMITASMMAFRDNPEAPGRLDGIPDRHDEIGVAGKELSLMQQSLRNALSQKERLAALGAAVAKVNHDLRNILSTAALLSERLEDSKDPNVSSVTPRLFDSLNRAIELCRQTLDYSKGGSLNLALHKMNLKEFISKVGQDLDAEYPDHVWHNDIADDVYLKADPEHLARVFMNLGRNAYAAGAKMVTISATVKDTDMLIDIHDDGPGLSDRAQNHLFEPFKASSGDGTGLGLAIAAEIVHAHGGDIYLAETGADGTKFRLRLRHV